MNRDSLGISQHMAAKMMLQAGIDSDRASSFFRELESIATYDGAPYFDSVAVSRLIKRIQKGPQS
jgi:hypothetical protein